MKKIPFNVRCSGWYVFVAGFALVVLCVPLLQEALREAIAPGDPDGSRVGPWVCVFLFSGATVYLLREFFTQCRVWWRYRR
jgi:hypothetical protein